ncbi:hypothetical protein LOK49_LG07G00854 [Camellia lanceoleosa]|uniref:Uncharacterized protein n=1 Tax=Camellia lanceoleosa TaxID=1840588 RepID=A0ACC0GYS2_9ERIC|nr:hypothetical protein LOK49_LG07G00854 [Camellia lanceoleosa]
MYLQCTNSTKLITYSYSVNLLNLKGYQKMKRQIHCEKPCESINQNVPYEKLREVKIHKG